MLMFGKVQLILSGFVLHTQVGSPAVHLRLACCTAWVKRWSKAMDFLQTIFKTNIFLLRIFERQQLKKMYAKYNTILRILILNQK